MQEHVSTWPFDAMTFSRLSSVARSVHTENGSFSSPCFICVFPFVQFYEVGHLLFHAVDLRDVSIYLPWLPCCCNIVVPLS